MGRCREIVGFGAAIAIISLGTVAATSMSQDVARKIRERRYPAQVYFAVSDLNMDGTPDMVLERADGYKIPFFGLQNDDKITYVSAKTMRLAKPKLPTDYAAIERSLNENPRERVKNLPHLQ
ncbi:MAG: hypothetical protein HYW25_03985 [Candidatus Aenigmarchaeota archaeon]|nr:hypothetical protein [Candidatus Aenigmarchaeota archaeon]